MSLGQATTMKGMLTYEDDFSKAEGLNMCWQKDTTAAAANANLGFEARSQIIIVRPVHIRTSVLRAIKAFVRLLQRLQ